MKFSFRSIKKWLQTIHVKSTPYLQHQCTTLKQTLIPTQQYYFTMPKPGHIQQPTQILWLTRYKGSMCQDLLWCRLWQDLRIDFGCLSWDLSWHLSVSTYIQLVMSQKSQFCLKLFPLHCIVCFSHESKTRMSWPHTFKTSKRGMLAPHWSYKCSWLKYRAAYQLLYK